MRPSRLQDSYSKKQDWNYLESFVFGMITVAITINEVLLNNIQQFKQTGPEWSICKLWLKEQKYILPILL